MFGLDKTLQFLQGHGQIDLLYWLFGGTLALIVLFFLSRLIRNVIGYRVRQVEEFGMDFDSVADMLDRNLLTPEEAKRVKSALSRHFQQMYEKKSKKPETTTALPEEAVDALQSKDDRPVSSPASPESKTQQVRPPDHVPHGGPPPAHPTAAQPKQTSAPPPDEIDSVEIPIDVLDMYEAGMITDEEMEALRKFYATKKKTDS